MLIRSLSPLAGLLLLASCSQSQDVERLTITGSSTVAPVVAELARVFERNNKGVRIDVQTGGSSRGIADAKAGLADIGMASRAIASSDGVQAHLLALDGLAIIVNQHNKVAELSEAQLQSIYTGATKRWGDLGVMPDGAITVVHKAAGRSTQEVFLDYFELSAAAVKPSVIIGDNEQGIKTVAGNKAAIGYVSVGAAQYAAANRVPIKLLPLNGVTASTEQVKARRYALSRQLNLVTASEPGGVVSRFIRFAQSKQAVPIIESLYFVPVLEQ